MGGKLNHDSKCRQVQPRWSLIAIQSKNSGMRVAEERDLLNDPPYGLKHGAVLMKIAFGADVVGFSSLD